MYFHGPSLIDSYTENLPPSSKFGNSDIGYTAAFRELAQQYGAMKTFKAYLEVNTLKPHRRDALQSMGLTLLDCPHRGKKEVADKMMIGTRYLSSWVI